MSLELVAQGTGLINVPGWDESLPEGTKLELWVSWPWNWSSQVQWAVDQLGVDLSGPVRYENGAIVIPYIKYPAWLIPVAAALVALGLAAAAWGLYKVVEVGGVPLGLGALAVVPLIVLVFAGKRFDRRLDS